MPDPLVTTGGGQGSVTTGGVTGVTVEAEKAQADFLKVLQQGAGAGATVPLKVYGSEVEVPLKEAITLAQKGLAADARFQEASVLLKEGAGDKAIVEDLRLMREGDADAFRRVGAAMNLPGDEVEDALQHVFSHFGEDDSEFEDYDESEDQEGTRPARGGRQQEDRDEKPQKVEYWQLSPELQDLNFHMEAQRQAEIIQTALDKDDVVAYYMKNSDASGKEAIIRSVRDGLNGRLKQPGVLFGDGTKILKEVLSPIRDLLKVHGNKTRENAPVGFGPAPGATGGEVHPTRKPERVNSNRSGDFDDYVTQVLMHNAATADAP